MNDIDIKELAKTLIHELDSERKISPETHELHHDYIRHKLSKEEKKDAMWEGVKKQILGWGIIIILSGIGIAVNEWFQHAINGK